MNQTHDIIIIGAGINGLTAGAMLARSGQRVLLVEQHDQVGGATITEEIAPGFRVDTVLHDLGWFNPAISQEIELSRLGLSHFQADPGVTALLPGDSLPLWRDTGRAGAAIGRFSTHDAEKWPAFCQRISRLAGFLKTLYGQPAPEAFSDEIGEAIRLLGIGRRLRGLGKQDMMEMVRMLPMSVKELLDDWFESDALKGLIGASGITNLQEGPRAAGTAFVLLHHLVGQETGVMRAPRLPLGGIGQLAQALAEAFRFYNGELLLSAPVAQILVQDGAAIGIRLSNGDIYTAPRMISTVDSGQTYLRLIDPIELEPTFLRAVSNIKYRGVRAKVNLALGELPRFQGVAEALLRGYLSLSPSLDYLERAADAAKYGKISEKPYLEAFIPTLTDPSLAPPGKHILSIWMQYAPYNLESGVWDATQRATLGDLVIETLAQYSTNLKNAIIERQVLTPLDLEEKIGSCQGNIYGGELTLDQILFMRPLPGWAQNRTPIQGLYLGGNATHPGGGQAGAAGYLAARRVLKDLKG